MFALDAHRFCEMRMFLLVLITNNFIALHHLRESSYKTLTSVEVEFHLAYENENYVQYKILEREYETMVYRTMVTKYTWYVSKIQNSLYLFEYITY